MKLKKVLKFFSLIFNNIYLGDQVLEWNGVLLRGKTFEEVERIINASTGEIEIIVKKYIFLLFTFFYLSFFLFGGGD